MLVTVGPSGRDYTSASAAEAGEQADFVSRADGVIIECDAFEESGSLVFDGATTNATYYWTLRAAAGAEAAMTYAGSGYRITHDGTTISVRDPYTRIERIAVRSTQTTFRYGVEFTAAGSNNGTIRGCSVFRTAGTGHCVYSGENTTVENCFARVSGTGTGACFQHAGGNGVVYRNCTAVGGTYGFRKEFSAMPCFNCLSVDASTAAFSAIDSSSSHNASDDATADDNGSSSRINQTFTFVDEANGDYHLASSDGGARTFGTDLSAYFTDDFDGETRSGSWDIGCDQYIAGGGPTEQSVSGSLAVSGALVKEKRQLLAGTASPTAALAKQAQRTLAGGLSTSATLVRAAAKPLTGTLSPAAALAAVRALLRAVDGSTTPAGTLARVTGKGAAGTVAPAGAVAKHTAKQVAGTTTPTGALLRGPRTLLAGVVTLGGTVAALRSYLRAFSGAVTPSGILTPLGILARAIEGTLSLGGALVKRPGKTVGGSVAPTGTATRAVWKLVGGQLTIAAVVAKEARKRFAATIPLTGVTVTVAGTFAQPGPHPLRIAFVGHGKTIAFVVQGKRIRFERHDKTIRFEP